MKVLVLDTSALIMGLDPLGLEFEIFSVPEVTEELKGQAGPSYRVVISISSGKLRIRSPTPRSLKQVRDKAKALGDRVVLSDADTSVVALALDLAGEGMEPIVVSDDYAVQNVAEGIDIAYRPLQLSVFARNSNGPTTVPRVLEDIPEEKKRSAKSAGQS